MKALATLGPTKITFCVLEDVDGYEVHRQETYPTSADDAEDLQDSIDYATCSPCDVLKFLHRTQPQMGISPPRLICDY